MFIRIAIKFMFFLIRLISKALTGNVKSMVGKTRWELKTETFCASYWFTRK